VAGGAFSSEEGPKPLKYMTTAELLLSGATKHQHEVAYHTLCLSLNLYTRYLMYRIPKACSLSLREDETPMARLCLELFFMNLLEHFSKESA
jgi:hypothetical protein